MKTVLQLACPLVLLLGGSAMAQSNIDAARKWSWAENAGWINWFDNGAASGARVNDTYLSGFIWSEAFGWVFLGNGTPAGGLHYSNLTAADTGVNVASNGDLFGFAWAENFGWINFNTAVAGPNRGRVEFCCPVARFRGYAWGENVGWISLETAFGVNLAAGAGASHGDLDGNGVRNGNDIQRFISVLLDPSLATARELCSADMNGDGVIDTLDLSAMVSCLLTGSCPC